MLSPLAAAAASLHRIIDPISGIGTTACSVPGAARLGGVELVDLAGEAMGCGAVGAHQQEAIERVRVA